MATANGDPDVSYSIVRHCGQVQELLIAYVHFFAAHRDQELILGHVVRWHLRVVWSEVVDVRLVVLLVAAVVAVRRLFLLFVCSQLGSILFVLVIFEKSFHEYVKKSVLLCHARIVRRL